MTALTDQIDRINRWMARDFDVEQGTEFIRMGEERLNTDLRIADMIKIDTALSVNGRVRLPDDWQESDFIRVIDGCPLKFVTRDVMYGTNAINEPNFLYDKYAITGNYLILGYYDATVGTSLELSYYASVPALGEVSTWLVQKHPRLALSSYLVAATAYGIEDDRAAAWEMELSSSIMKLNDAHSMARSSGSRINSKPKKGFG